jgi:hypothetical protein
MVTHVCVCVRMLCRLCCWGMGCDVDTTCAFDSVASRPSAAERRARGDGSDSDDDVGMDFDADEADAEAMALAPTSRPQLPSDADTHASDRAELDAYLIALQNRRDDDGMRLVDFPAEYDNMVEEMHAEQREAPGAPLAIPVWSLAPSLLAAEDDTDPLADHEMESAPTSTSSTGSSTWAMERDRRAHVFAERRQAHQAEQAKLMKEMEQIRELDRILAQKTKEAHELAQSKGSSRRPVSAVEPVPEPGPSRSSLAVGSSKASAQHEASATTVPPQKVAAALIEKNRALAKLGPRPKLLPEEETRLQTLLAQPEFNSEDDIGILPGQGFWPQYDEVRRLVEIDTRLQDLHPTLTVSHLFHLPLTFAGSTGAASSARDSSLYSSRSLWSASASSEMTDSATLTVMPSTAVSSASRHRSAARPHGPPATANTDESGSEDTRAPPRIDYLDLMRKERELALQVSSLEEKLQAVQRARMVPVLEMEKLSPDLLRDLIQQAKLEEHAITQRQTARTVASTTPRPSSASSRPSSSAGNTGTVDAETASARSRPGSASSRRGQISSRIIIRDADVQAAMAASDGQGPTSARLRVSDSAPILTLSLSESAAAGSVATSVSSPSFGPPVALCHDPTLSGRLAADVLAARRARRAAAAAAGDAVLGLSGSRPGSAVSTIGSVSSTASFHPVGGAVPRPASTGPFTVDSAGAPSLAPRGSSRGQGYDMRMPVGTTVAPRPSLADMLDGISTSRSRPVSSSGASSGVAFSAGAVADSDVGRRPSVEAKDRAADTTSGLIKPASVSAVDPAPVRAAGSRNSQRPPVPGAAVVSMRSSVEPATPTSGVSASASASASAPSPSPVATPTFTPGSTSVFAPGSTSVFAPGSTSVFGSGGVTAPRRTGARR